MISDLALKDPSIEDTKLADENLKHQEAKQAEGDDLQVKLSSKLNTKAWHPRLISPADVCMTCCSSA